MGFGTHGQFYKPTIQISLEEVVCCVNGRQKSVFNLDPNTKVSLNEVQTDYALFISYNQEPILPYAFCTFDEVFINTEE